MHFSVSGLVCHDLSTHCVSGAGVPLFCENHSNQFIPGCDKFRYSSINPDGMLDLYSFALENGYTQVII